MQPSPFARANSPQSVRGTATTERSRGRARGRGRGRGLVQGNAPSASPDASNSFQSGRGSAIRAGLGGANRGLRSRGTRGSGRGAKLSRSFNSPSSGPTQSSQTGVPPPPPIDPRPEDIRETNHDVIAARRTKLHGQYEQYQKRAIQQKLMSDPDKREKLENAIFTKGTCTHMCDEKERVDRIFELQLDRAEMLPHPETGQLVPIEGRMVKRFRRSAAGAGKQIPEELRTPEMLQKTMDYLINNVIGPNPRLAQHHKFVWDRTRAIRNDCSIQSFTQPEDVKREVDCYERIARFHILSSHLLSKHDALQNGEDFVHKQEIEQLTKTFQTLMDKYDGYSQTLEFPHEAEFRAYFILFAPMTTIADLDDQVQRWPRHVLDDGRVQTALKLRATAESTDQPVGSRRFEPVPCFIAQKNAGLYWELLRSQRVGYLMACVAEMNFRNIRFAALDSLWRTGKNAPEKGQATMRTWTRTAVRDYLGFDDDEQVEDFCSKFGLNFVSNASSDQAYLDFKSHSAPSLDYSSLGQDQVFSESIVESKRQGRNLVAVLNGMSIAAASRSGMIEERPTTASSKTTFNRSSMFLSTNAEDDDVDEAEEQLEQPPASQAAGVLNPLATSFTPGAFKSSVTEEASKQPGWMTGFGQSRTADSAFAATPPKDIFRKQNGEVQKASASAQSPFQSLGAFQSNVARTLDSTNVNPAPSLQAKDANAFAPATQPPPSQSNPFFVPPSTSSSGSFQTTPKPTEKAPVLAPQEKQAPDALQIHEPFSWSPASTTAGSPKTPQSVFDITKPSQQTTEKSKFGFEPFTAPTSIPEAPLPSFAQVNPPTNKQSIGPTSAFTPPLLPPETDQSNRSLTSIKTAQNAPADANNQLPAAPATQSNATQPPFATFEPPPAIESKAITTTPAGSPIRSSNAFNLGTKTPPPPSNVNKTSFTSESAPRTAPESIQAPQRKPIDKDQLVENLCRIGLIQKDGILDMFVAARVNTLCHEVFQTFQTSRLNRKISKLKKIYLRRKFFALWRSRVNLKRLQKRAEKRKRMFAASVQAEKEKEKQRREEVAVLAEIVKSEQHKRKIQEEQRQREEEKARRQATELNQLQPHDASSAAAGEAPRLQTNTTQTAGQKRKMLVSKASRNDLQDIAMSPMHKRSRTLGTSSHNIEGYKATVKMAPLTNMAPSSNLRRSLSHRSLRQSVIQQGVDQTESDYFRLKALGVDPNTPLIPDTAASLAAKQRKEAEHRETILSKVKNRPSSMKVKTPPVPAPSSTNLPKSLSTSHIMSIAQPVTRPSPSIADESEDPFLRELREARQAMTADAEWLKSEAVKLEKEIEQQEEFRRSMGSNRSTEDLSTQSVNGFSRSINAHAYIPPILKSGQTLSRTEQRIRATGARGLANLPIGGSPRPASQYMPVAMSRRSASQLQNNSISQDKITSPSSRSKRSIDEVDDDARNGFAIPAQSIQATARRTSQPVIKKSRYDDPQSPSTRMSIQALQSLPIPRENGYGSGSPDTEATEDDETGDELEYVGQTQNGDGTYEYEDLDEDEEQYSGDLDDNEEGDEDADDDDQSDEEEEEGPPRTAYYPLQYGYAVEGEEHDEDDEEEEEEEEHVPGYQAQFATLAPGSGHGSRAVSAGVATPDTGLGSTVDDAIELSD